MDLEKEFGNMCMATAICRYTGSIVRCQKIANHEGSPHTFAGLQWNDLDDSFMSLPEEEEPPARFRQEDKYRSRPVPVIFSDLRFTIEGLWLTNGGRIVKPGGGECCSKEFRDYPLMTAEEMQNGIPLEEFRYRLNSAARKQRQTVYRIVKKH